MPSQLALLTVAVPIPLWIVVNPIQATALLPRLSVLLRPWVELPQPRTKLKGLFILA